MIRFTIITCTWNAAEVVERTLESVLSQSWTQIEHVIIDGASKDNTLQLVEAYRNGMQRKKQNTTSWWSANLTAVFTTL